VSILRTRVPRGSRLSVWLEDTIDACTRNLDAVVSRQIPDDPDRAEMIGSGADAEPYPRSQEVYD
jgi:hypothetical protein